jgi:hypothetical protein
MSKRREAERRHAIHPFGVLKNLLTQYESGQPDATVTLAQFDPDWGQVQPGHAWSLATFSSNRGALK